MAALEVRACNFRRGLVCVRRVEAIFRAANRNQHRLRSCTSLQTFQLTGTICRSVQMVHVSLNIVLTWVRTDSSDLSTSWNMPSRVGAGAESRAFRRSLSRFMSAAANSAFSSFVMFSVSAFHSRLSSSATSVMVGRAMPRSTSAVEQR